MFRLDPYRTNRSSYRAPKKPSLLWKHQTGGSIVSAPIVDASGIIVASLSGKIIGLDWAGKERWVRDYEERIYSSPLLLGTSLFVGLDKGKFVSLHTKTGKERFFWKTKKAFDADTGPLPLKDGLLFTAGPTVVAMKRSGTILFRHRAGGKVFTSPVRLRDGGVVFGDQKHIVTALESDGSLRWKRDLGSDVDSTPVVAEDGRIFVGDDEGKVVALDPQSGKVEWTQSVTSGHVRGPLSLGRDGTVLAATYGAVPSVVALDPAKGRILWEFRIRGTGAKAFGIHAAPLEDAEGTLVFGGQDDFVYALTPDGKLQWKLSFPGDVDSAVVVVRDRWLAVGCQDGNLYVFSDTSN
jgi:outer membrane protein assembly factor BamB